MPKVKDIYDYIDSLAPFANQCEWDNSGIATGNPEGEVTKIVFALDITNDVVDYAREVGAELAVSHHPVIFRARKSVLSNDPVYALVNAGISAICAHTSLDIADGGINDALTEKLGFGKCAPLTSSGEASMVRVYEFGEERSPEDVAAFVCRWSAGRVNRLCYFRAQTHLAFKSFVKQGNSGKEIFHEYRLLK